MRPGEICTRNVTVERNTPVQETAHLIAAQVDAARLTAGDITTLDVVTAGEDQSAFETVEQMQRNGIRRLQVVNKSGCLVGVMAADDLLELFAMQLTILWKVSASERRQELHARA